MSLKIDQLVPGHRYVFCTRAWEAPTGEVLGGERKERVYLGAVDVGPAGMVSVPFLKVQREGSYDHLIAVENIETIFDATEVPA